MHEQEPSLGFLYPGEYDNLFKGMQLTDIRGSHRQAQVIMFDDYAFANVHFDRDSLSKACADIELRAKKFDKKQERSCCGFPFLAPGAMKFVTTEIYDRSSWWFFEAPTKKREMTSCLQDVRKRSPNKRIVLIGDFNYKWGKDMQDWVASEGRIWIGMVYVGGDVVCVGDAGRSCVNSHRHEIDDRES